MLPNTPDGLDVLITRPCTSSPAFERSRQYAAAWRVGAKWPLRWTAITLSHSSSVMLIEHPVAQDAGVVDEDVEAPERVDGGLHHLACLREVCDVGAVRDRLAAGCLDLLDDLLRGGEVVPLAGERAAEIVDDELGARLRERERVAAPDPAPGAGDDCDLPRERWHVGENTRMDFTLTPEQELIRRSAREFCDREIVPNARDWDRSERMDEGIVPKLAEIGFLGCALPEEFGGMGLDTISYCLVMEELGRADSSVRGIVSVNNGLAGKTIAQVWDGSAEARVAAADVYGRGARVLRR